jgi:hypothetical protein
MQRLALADAKPAMILAADVFSDQQMLLLKKGTALSDKNIKVLKSWGVSSLTIESERDVTGADAEIENRQHHEHIAARIKKQFDQLEANEVVTEICRVATEIIIARTHHLENEDAG